MHLIGRDKAQEVWFGNLWNFQAISLVKTNKHYKTFFLWILDGAGPFTEKLIWMKKQPDRVNSCFQSKWIQTQPCVVQVHQSSIKGFFFFLITCVPSRRAFKRILAVSFLSYVCHWFLHSTDHNLFNFLQARLRFHFFPLCLLAHTVTITAYVDELIITSWTISLHKFGLLISCPRLFCKCWAW